MRLLRLFAAAALVAGLAVRPVAGADRSFYDQPFSKKPTVPAMTALGRALFSDPTLSASGKQSCASCHDPRLGFGPPNDLPVQNGGADGKLPGVRAVPSLRYLQSLPPFTEHFFDEEKDGQSEDQGPTGGHTWDGRADSAHDQARLPLLSPFEMANESPAAVVQRVEKGASAAGFRDAFGPDVFSSSDRAFAAVLLTFEVYQQAPKEFYPYNSRYDEWIRGKGPLSEAEQRGLKLYIDPAKGNCDSCHPARVAGGAFPQFTDFGFTALGVPRNPKIPANADPAYFDLGLCGPQRTDLEAHAGYCGFFRAPTLRNVALRKSFFHNGIYHDLHEAVRFYARRDTNPQEYYPTPAGVDLPAAYQENLENDAPFGRKPGEAPALTDAEIDDIVVFLKTLTDADLIE